MCKRFVPEAKMGFDKGSLNIAQLGFGLFLIFTANLTRLNIQVSECDEILCFSYCFCFEQFVVSSIKHDRNITGDYSGPAIAENAGYVR